MMVREYQELYNWLADDVEKGIFLLMGGRTVRELRQHHDSYVQNCREGFPHQESVTGVRRLAGALFGFQEDGEPFWSNNDRRRAGRGPMPIRRILRHRSREFARASATDEEETDV